MVTHAAARAGPRVPRPVAALAAQVTLAGGSLVLQLLAARELGADGLGQYALLFGATVMFTALSTGLIGDTLTVLDRDEPGVRAALVQIAGLTVAVAAVTGGAVVGFGTGLPAQVALAFAGATAVFMVADLLRRLLMAELRFGCLVVVDGTGLLASIAVLVGASYAGSLHLVDFLLALMLGQLSACAVAWCFLPRHERTRGHGPPAWGAVLGFGVWRATQQFVRPTVLNAARWLVLIAAGQAAVGELEAARVFVAPALLLVQGIGAYLFSSYAADRDRPIGTLLTRADRAAVVMLGAATLCGLAAAAGSGLLGPLLTGDQFHLEVPAVLGWTAYAASCAAVLPYGSLAAVRGHQAQVLVVRVLDSCLSLLLVAVLLLGVGTPSWSMPWLLCVGSFVGGWWCRRLLSGLVEEAPPEPGETDRPRADSGHPAAAGTPGLTGAPR